MEYVYKLTDKEGNSFSTIQPEKFEAKDVLEAFKSDDDSIVDCVFVGELPTGYHVCGCGNITKGPQGLLCPECQEIYGHKWESEL